MAENPEEPTYAAVVELKAAKRWRGYVANVAISGAVALLAVLGAIYKPFQELLPSTLTAPTAAIVGLSFVLIMALKWYLDTGFDKKTVIASITAEEREGVPPQHKSDEDARMPETSLDAPSNPMQMLTWEVIRHQLRNEKRLDRELGNLTRRGNTNLAIGAGTAFAGIVALFWFSLLLPPATKDNWPWLFLSQFTPRLATVIVLELFAYFFLNLYKTGLDEIKYYQGELTNIGSATLALTIAIEKNDVEALRKGVLRVVSTDRNAASGVRGMTSSEYDQLLKAVADTAKLASKLTAGGAAPAGDKTT
jgi:hypothetical protein